MNKDDLSSSDVKGGAAPRNSDPGSRRRVNKSLLAIILVCFSVRLGLFLLARPWIPAVADNVILTSDALGYHQLAVHLADYRQYPQESGLSNLRTPLYPAFVALLYIIFGKQPYIILLAQILLDTFSCYLLFRTISRALNTTIAAYASIFYALDPHLVLFSNSLYSDTLFICFTVLGYFFISKLFKDTPQLAPGPIVLSAIFFGLGTLTRPISMYIPVIVLAVLIIVFRKSPENIPKTGLRGVSGDSAAAHTTKKGLLRWVVTKALIYSLLFTSIFTLVLLPWMFRNQKIYHSFSLSTSGAYNLLALNITPMEMERRGIDDRIFVREALFEEAEGLMIQQGLNPDDLNDYEKTQFWQKLAISTIRERPLSYVKHHALGIFRMFASLGTGSYAELLQLNNEVFESTAYHNIVELIRAWLRRRTAVQLLIGAVIGLYLFSSYLFAGIGLLKSKPGDYSGFLLFSLAMAVYFILLTGPAGRPRLRLPIIPFYLPFVGIGFSILIRRRRSA